MSYNATKEERQRRAAVDLAKKLSLELKLSKDMRTIFSKISKSAKHLYISNGSKLNAWAFKDQIKGALAKHYQHVFKQFQPEMKNDIIKVIKKAGNDNLDLFNQTYITSQSDVSANQITNTTQKKLNQAYALAIAGYVAPDGDMIHSDPIDRAAIAATASASFDADAASRSDVIATTETQNAAEAGKINVISSQVDTVTQVNSEKEWSTIMDGRERDSHREANGQIQGLTSPFVVQGQLLNYPSDNSLGATPDNLINCRCSAQYIIKG